VNFKSRLKWGLQYTVPDCGHMDSCTPVNNYSTHNQKIPFLISDLSSYVPQHALIIQPPHQH